MTFLWSRVTRRLKKIRGDGDRPVLSPLSAEFDCSRFDCNDDDGEINSFIQNTALAHHRKSRSLTRVVHFSGDFRVIAYITTSMGLVRLELDGLPIQPVGCIHVAYLGVQREYQHKGYGTNLLRLVIDQARKLSSEVGCRGVGLNCRDRRLKWYEKQGFQCFDTGEDTGGPLNKMFFDIRSPSAPTDNEQRAST